MLCSSDATDGQVYLLMHTCCVYYLSMQLTPNLELGGEDYNT